MRWILEWDGDIQLEFAGQGCGWIFSLTKHSGTQNSIQIGLGKGGKHLFPSTSQGVNRIQCSCSEDFNKPGFQLETYSQLDLGIGLPLFSCPRNLRGWIR